MTSWRASIRPPHRVTDEVVLGKGGDPDCGMCADQVIYAFDSAWTANDLGRSITRVDGQSLKATTFPTYNRVWSVAAYGRYIYGSEVENIDGYIDRSIGGLVRIDPRTGTVDQYPAPGVLGVAALGDYLWLIVPGETIRLRDELQGRGPLISAATPSAPSARTGRTAPSRA